MAAPLGVNRAVKSLCCCRQTVRQLNWSRICRQMVRTAATTGKETTTPQKDKSVKVGFAGQKKAQEISQAMKHYLEVRTKQDKFLNEQIADYEIGKRHLANMMGKDADSFEQEDIDTALEYLMPSALWHRGARPQMRHPSKVLPKQAKASFGLDGRPFDPFFYTGFPNFYKLMHTMDVKLDELKAFEDQMIAKKIYIPGKDVPGKDIALTTGSVPISKGSLAGRTGEPITDAMHDQFTRLLQRLIEQPFANNEKEFIMKHRVSLVTKEQMKEIEPLKYNEAGNPYAEGRGRRKTCTVWVRVTGSGTGRIVLNGKEFIDALPREMDREQLLPPLQITGLLGEVDIEGTSEGPSGGASLAGATRLAVAKALQSFVNKATIEKLRLAGLLTTDPRRRERKKPGRMKARRKYTWKKR